MRVLLHTCCAPCTTFPLAFLRSMGYRVHALFVNPNIYPADEVERRYQTLERFAAEEGMPLSRADVHHRQWLEAVSADPRRPFRCAMCYRLRLDETARLARRGGYDFFTTSLLLSVYQDHKSIVDEAERASSKYGIAFLYHDFRKGYKRSREMARGRHLYLQKYCGCEFSLSESASGGDRK